jgi:hypothetical protein
MYLLWHDCFEHFCLGCGFCCFMRGEGGCGGGCGGGDRIFGVSCRCGYASFFVFLGLGLGGDGIFCVPSGCGDGMSCRCGD